MQSDHPSQTRCPECNANLWVYPDRGPTMRCVCGHEFTPSQLKSYVTGKQKREAQSG